MPFGVVSVVGRGMGVLDGGGDRRRESGSFGGKFGASQCNFLVLLCESDALFPNFFGGGPVIMIRAPAKPVAVVGRPVAERTLVPVRTGSHVDQVDTRSTS